MDIALSCFLGPSGISRAGQEYFKLMTSKGLRVIPNFLLPPQTASVRKSIAEQMVEASNKPLDKNRVQFFVGLPHHLVPLRSTKSIIGNIVFEGGRLTAQQATACSKMHLVCAPSSFCLDGCWNSGVRKNLVFLGYPLDTTIWHPQVIPTLAGTDKFRFLYMNTWYHRKGNDLLLRAWWEEFSKDDNVELYIKTYQEDTNVVSVLDSVRRLMSECSPKNPAPIYVLNEPMQDEAIPGFMKSFDCIISPHRAEGFGMNVWYAMSLGVPAICTDYGGTRDFAKENTAWLIPVSDISKPSEEELKAFPHLQGQSWAEPDFHSLKRRMREVLNNPKERTQRAEEAQLYVASEYNYEIIFNQMRDYFSTISLEVNSQFKLGKIISMMDGGKRYDGKSAKLIEIP